MTSEWTNWSGSQKHNVKNYFTPSSEEELSEILQSAKNENLKVRCIGSGHSFVPFWTDDILISLDNLSGLIETKADTQTASVWAGTKLHELGPMLWQQNLAMENMGDIDRQSIAGAISTGTHGTGADLSNISSQVRALDLIDVSGRPVHIDQGTPDLLDAARLSLGSLGILTKINMQLIPAYYLHEKNWTLSVESCGQCLDELIAKNRHLEFFWDPQSDQCIMKSLNKTPRQEDVQLAEQEFIGKSYKIYPSDREHKFNETEFTLDRDKAWQCFLDIRNLIKTRFPKVRWPLEFRTVKADSALLSPSAQKDCVTISAHEGAKREHVAFFLAVEAIFIEYGARPHWGKVHTHKREQLALLLPKFTDFCDIRKEYDPEGRLLNSFLYDIFGID